MEFGLQCFCENEHVNNKVKKLRQYLDYTESKYAVSVTNVILFYKE